MNDRLKNRLNMINTCLGLANSSDYKPVWTGKDPADFGTDLATLGVNYNACIAKAALADGTKDGSTDAKASAESTVEDTTYVLARALAVHFKKNGNLTSLGKADIAKRDLVKLSGQPLIVKATEIRDLGTAASADADAANRGITAARVTAVTDAIAAYAPLVNAPRGQIVNRSALLKEIETDTATMLDQLADLDDLILLLESSEASQRFQAAWKRARIIVDAGHGPAPEQTPAPAPAPAQ